MKRKTSTTPTRIWTFGGFAPLEQMEVVEQQLQLGAIYYDTLIQIENERRRRFRQIRAKYTPELLEVEQKLNDVKSQLDSVRDEIKSNKSKAHLTKSKEGQAEKKRLQAQAKGLKEIRSALHDRAEQLREEAKENPELKLEVETTVDTWASETIKKAHADSGLYWGTYLLIDKQVEAARKSPSDPEPHGRLFKIFDLKPGKCSECQAQAVWQHTSKDEKYCDKHVSFPPVQKGRIGIQSQAMLTTGKLMAGGNTVIRIDALPEDQWDTRSGRRHARTKVHFRVGPKDNPVWATFPIVLHRKLPEGIVKWAWVKVEKVGRHLRYEFQLSIESSEFEEGPCGKGSIALDVGWRSVDETENYRHGIRVACGVDDKGRVREFVLPDYQIHPESGKHTLLGASRFEFVTKLRSASDSCFEVARNELSTWMRANKGPKWLKPETATIAHWRNHANLARIAYRLGSESLPADELCSLWGLWKKTRHVRNRNKKTRSAKNRLDLFEVGRDEVLTLENFTPWLVQQGITDPVKQLAVYLEWWRRKNRHLYEYATNMYEKMRNHRKNLYREWASELRSEYKTIILRNVNYSKIARTPEAEQDQTQRIAQKQRMTAAPSEFISCLLSAVGKDRIEKLTVDDVCLDCGHDGFDDSASQVNTCTQCGAASDQDERMARLLLKQYHEQFGHGQTPAPARKNNSSKKRGVTGTVDQAAE